MKKANYKIRKVKPINGTDIYYTYSNWPIEEINGEDFIPVVKQKPSNDLQQKVHYMKKDTMEYVK